MSQFITNAAQVLRKMSQRNEASTLLINHTWLFMDKKYQDEKFHFQENGELIIEKDKVKNKYKWEFTSADSRLKIVRNETQMYYVLFIDKAVVIIQRDTDKQEYEFLANVKHVNPLEVESYIHNAVAKHMNISLMRVTDGFDMEIHRRHSDDTIGTPGQQVTRDLKSLEDGMYKSSTSSFIYEVQDSHIVRKNSFFKITLSDGRQAGLFTENKGPFVSAGDTIMIEQKKIDDGKYFTHDSWMVVSKGKVNQTGPLARYKTGKGLIIVEQHDNKPAAGDIAYYESGSPLDGEVSIGMFKKIKASNGKLI
jgi:hypothetical protein